MAVFRQLRRGLSALVRRTDADRETDAEVQQYVDHLTRELIAAGLTPGEAQRAARLQIGNPTVVREQVRSSGWEHGVETMLADVQYALRRLRSNLGFTVIAVTTLALSIGATTAIFSAVNPILLRALPYPDAARLVAVVDRRADGSSLDVTYGTVAEVSARARSFASTAAADRWMPSLTGTNEPERLHGERVSASFFRTLGVRPAAGRDFDPAEDRQGGPNVVVLSDRLVRRRFAGDLAIIGRAVMLDGDPYRVVGVMPASFIDVLAPATDIWAPLQAHAVTDFQSREWGHHYRMIARLASGATARGAMREIDAIARATLPEFARPPWAAMSNGLLVHSLQDESTADARPALLAIVGAVLVLLLIACVNVTNLLLARGVQRRGEFAMRVALGAGRGRLLRQLLTESMILAAIGGTFGLLVANAGVRALVALAPAGLPRVDAIRLDASVFGFAAAMTTLVGLLIGFLPALVATRASLRDGLQTATHRAGGGRTAARNVLVVAELSLAIVLLVSAGLLMRSLDRLFGVAPGFDASHLLTMQVVEAGYGYRRDDDRARFYEQALDAVRAVPGVVEAAFTSQLPLSGDFEGYGFTFASSGAKTADDDNSSSALRYSVSPEYFRTMRIPLRDGRYLDASDRADAPGAVVISESFARWRFGKASPIGQRVRFGPQINGDRWGTVVGVVGDVKQTSLEPGQSYAFYVPPRQWVWVDNQASLIVRTSGDAAALTPAIKRAVWSVDRNQPITRIATMDHLIAGTAAQRRFASIVFQTFALTALVLAAIGLYGVVAGRVAEQTREIGIRTALGATSARIVRHVVGNGLILTGVGIVLGFCGAFVASRMLESLLFAVTRADPITYIGVIGLLAGVAVLACWSPARRAAGIDPAITLRAE
jgi:putative ABC transport system permease protein